MNDFVPSIGSRIHRQPLVPVRSGSSSPRIASSGKVGGNPLAQQLLRAAVSDRHRRRIGLPLDRQPVALKILERQSPRLASCRQANLQTGVQFFRIQTHIAKLLRPRRPAKRRTVEVQLSGRCRTLKRELQRSGTESQRSSEGKGMHRLDPTCAVSRDAGNLAPIAVAAAGRFSYDSAAFSGAGGAA